MRGFPLLNTLAVAAAFVLAWFPLRPLGPGAGPVAAGHGHAEAAEIASDAGEETWSLRLYATAPLARLRVEYLGQPLLDLADASGLEEIARDFQEPSVPREGLELWIEAEFVPEKEGAPGSSRAAVGVEASRFGRETKEVTLWSDHGAVADSVWFYWEDEDDGAGEEEIPR